MMRTALFYESHSEQAIPLYFLSEMEWSQGNNKDEYEKNYFLARQFRGKIGDYCLIHNQSGVIEKAYIGTGNDNQSLAIAKAATQLPPGCYVPQQTISHTANVMWSLAQYCFAEYKQQERQPRKLIVNAEALPAILTETAAIFLVRDLINKPTNDLGPAELATILSNIGKKYNAHFKQWVGDELLAAKFQAIHTVGRAAAVAPRLLNLEWGNKQHPQLVLIGKGVCFDSGGLDIKPSSAMRFMKKDMGGAAHVMGLAEWIMAKKLPVYLRVFIPAVENAIGPNAFRPGDIITMYNGLTVEIDNTDAEGRLVLADALAKACEEKPDLIINFATLTGAARVAVGAEIAAMFSNDDTLAQAILDSSASVADPIWRLPLFAGYEDMLNSSVADLVNSSTSPYAGAITAALFLQRFITPPLSWVHFDIMAWNLCNKPGKPEGGEALALRAMMHFLEKKFKPDYKEIS